MALLTHEEYLGLGRRIMPLLGSALCGPSAEALRELARAYDPSAEDSRIGAEVFLFHKYLLMQACVGVFPESQVDHIVGGLVAALNERAGGLDLGPERQQAMEEMWRIRAGQFDPFFEQDRQAFLGEQADLIHWRETIGQFCRNIREVHDPPDIWAGSDHPSHRASHSVTTALDQMVSSLEEIKREHFPEAV